MKKRTIGVNCSIKYKVILDGKVSEVKTKDGKTIWNLIKEFVNSKKDGEQFTRKELILYIYELPIYSLNLSCDTYRNYITSLGFIKKVKNGVYVKVENIPNETTIKNIVDAYSKRDTWESWFKPLSEIGKNINEL